MYSNPLEAVREIERDIWEMGLRVHPDTMQDLKVADNPDYETIEVRAYGFQLLDWIWDSKTQYLTLKYLIAQNRTPLEPTITEMTSYMDAEFLDRISKEPRNPGRSYVHRAHLWRPFLHGDPPRFAYTYSERLNPQLTRIIGELINHPNTRQAVVNIHSNICPARIRFKDGNDEAVQPSDDLANMGGTGRIPCSMYYQFLRRLDRLDMVYTMRSCDFVTHFPVDLFLALKLQTWMARQLAVQVGTFTYFTGSLHAYAKDLKDRGIF